jgi:hypothetical protein
MYWDDPENEVFSKLCDVVCSNELIVVTGAGVSVGLRTKADPEKKLPNWKQLVFEVFDSHKDVLDAQARRDIPPLLAGADISAEFIIEAAEILREKLGADKFLDSVIKATEPVAGSKSEAHHLIRTLGPKGIVTFNYDLGHENADGGRAFIPMTYRDTGKMIRILNEGFREKFILKAHGCVKSRDTIVLDRTSYRHILAENPTYRAFFEHALTRFNALFIGFGMKDPDFDDLLRTLEFTYQGKGREHIYIFKSDPDNAVDNAAKEVMLRRRFGVTSLEVRDFREIDRILEQASNTVGPKTKQMIDDCLTCAADSSEAAAARALAARRAGHEKLQKLNDKGKEIVAGRLMDILALEGEAENVRAEAAYSLGKLLPMDEATAQCLAKVIESAPPPEVGVHCLIALDGFLPERGAFEKWLSRLERLKPCAARIDAQLTAAVSRGPPRARVYLDALIAKWRATLCAK